MSVTDKYGLEETPIGTVGWNDIATANMQKVDAYLHTRLEFVAGEALAAYEAVYVDTAGKASLAQADQAKQPCVGLALAAVILDEDVLVQRVGPITNGAWTWTPGRPVYLSSSVAGALTHTPPALGKQLIGVALSATSILLTGTIDHEALATTTTTTTTTTAAPTTTTTTI